MMPILIAAVLFHQDSTPTRPARPNVRATLDAASETTPVTAREANAAFAQMAQRMGKVTDRSLGTVSIAKADRPATRVEVLGEMVRMLKAAEPAIRFTPMPVPYEANRLNIATAQRASLSRLIAGGFVAPVGPLAVGPGPGLSLREFGDALGYFMARLSQISHLPSPRWTPALQKDQ